MKTFKHYSNMALISALFMMTFFMGGCGSSSCDETSRPAIDATQPYVTSTIPAKGAINVPLDQIISATLNEAFNPDTVNEDTFTVVDANGDLIPGAISYSNNNTVMIFAPEVTLDYNTTYTATVTTGVTDIAGNALDDSNELNVWSFTTITEADILPPAVNTPPYVISTIPEDNATNVPLNQTVSALISEELDDNTTGQNTFRLYDMTDPSVPVEVSGAVDYANRIMTFDPDQNLSADTNYTARISASIEDLEGAPMGQAYEWSFTTGTTVAVSPEPVILNTAGDFAILTKAGISNTVTALTLITGDIGVSPIDHTAITNFALIGEPTTDTFLTSPYVIGNVYAANLFDPTPDKMTVAVGHMEDAYIDAAGRPAAVGANLNIGAGTLNSTTPIFASGLYTWGSNVTITDSITLTGSADDTWIFQISGNLILASGAQIILGPNVQAKNIVWQVAGTNVTIGTDAKFSGIILAKELIAVQTRASVDGRLLSQTAVSLDQNVITQPAP